MLTDVTMELLTVPETAQLLRVSPMTVRRFIADGRLPAVRVGKGLRVRREAIKRLAKPVAPTVPERPRQSFGRPTSADDPLWSIVGIGHSDGSGDVARNHDRYLAEAYADRHDA
jgi:excisionase family DNA binding protein